MSTPRYDKLGWSTEDSNRLVGYRIGSGLLRSGFRLHVIRVTDSGPGAVSEDALCGGLQGVCVVGIRNDDDTHHSQAKRRRVDHSTAQGVIDAVHQRQAPRLCPRCAARAPRALAAEDAPDGASVAPQHPSRLE